MPPIKITSTAATRAEEFRKNPAQPDAAAKALLAIANNARHAKAKRILVQGKSHTLAGGDVEFENMADAGFVLITSIGSENLYFKFHADDGAQYSGFCKCL